MSAPDTPTEDPKPAPKPRQRKPRSFDIEPIMVSKEVAADMLADISERTLDQLIADKKITPRQITPGRVGILVDELRAFAASLPKVAA